MSCVMDQKKPMLIAILYVSERHLTDKKYVGGNFMGQMFVEGKVSFFVFLLNVFLRVLIE